VSTALISACASVRTPAPGTSPTLDGLDLGGEWEWRDDATVQRIVLDKNGNGAYPWQNGHIVTTSVSDGRWEGIWSQEGNDREGGFEVLLTGTGSDAEGTWWYTRIGTRTIPAREQGASFRMRRLSAETARHVP
jgi:hypothetical protein